GGRGSWSYVISFFQAEGGIRDWSVTGVQTCALPIAATARGPGPWRVASPADAMLRGAWWRVFREPELDALEAQLRAGNQTIAQAVANFMAARAVIRQAQAQYFPTVTTSPSVITGRS